MGEVASAYVSLVPSLKGFKGKIESGIGGDLDKAGREGGKRYGAGLSGALGGLGGKVFAPLAAAAAAVGVGNFLKDAIAEARESQKVGAITANVIKTTGQAAKVTAADVGNLAMSISNKTGIDDEAIQSASNLLLTFTGLRNETGKGNDVFNQATQAATDLGAAMGTEPKAAAIQLGKALNDPVKGITALTRVGVSFTAQQKDQIAALVKSGDTLGAQKIILGELNKEFGGTAAASATAGEKLSTAFGNFKEQIGTALLPVIDKLEGAITSRVLPALSGFITGIQNGIGAGGAFRAFVVGIYDALVPVGAFITGTVVPAVATFVQGLRDGTGAGGAFRAFLVGIVGSLQSVGAFVQSNSTLLLSLAGSVGAVVAALKVWAVVTKVMAAAQLALNFVLTANPLGLVLLAVVALVAGLVLAYKTSATFRGIVNTAFTEVLAIGRQVFSTLATVIRAALVVIQTNIAVSTAAIKFIWNTFGASLVSIITGVLSGLLTTIRGALNVIQGVFKTVMALLTGDWSGAWAGMRQVVTGALQIIQGVVRTGLALVRGIADLALDGIRALFSAGWAALTAIVRGAAGGITGTVSSLFSSLRSVVSGGLNVIEGLFSSGWAGLRGIVSSAFGAVRGAVSDGVGSVVGIVSALPGRILGALGNLGGLLFNSGARLIQGFADGVASRITAVIDKVRSMAAQIKSFLPGSPVKQGPLTAWNNGAAGERLVGLLADGIDAGTPDAVASMRRLSGRLQVTPQVRYAGSGSGAHGVLGGPAGPASAGGGQTVNFNGPLYAYDPTELLRAADLRARDAAVVANLQAIGA